MGFTARRTMAAAQSLYEGVDLGGRLTQGLITYMRTDSLRISDEAKAMVRSYIGERYGADFLPKEARAYKTRQSAQDAHEAIRPTMMLEPDDIKDHLKSDEYKLYKLIFTRFVASQCESARYKTVSADIAAGEALFKMSESCLEFAGYQSVYADEEETLAKKLPALKQGDELAVSYLSGQGHFTEPPARYNEASLIRAMEEAGIGRPSTYAPTLSTILSRRYVVRDKKNLLPTDLGTLITSMLRDYFENIVDIEFTATMETDLDKVGEGKKAWAGVVRDFYKPFSEDLKKAEEELGRVELKDEETDIPCEVCGRKMIIKNGRFGRFLACPGYPACSFTKAIVEETGVKCPVCGDEIVGRTSKRGKKYYPCQNRACNFLVWDKPTGQTCEVCGALMVKKTVRGDEVIRCSNRDCESHKKKGKSGK